VSVVEIFWNVHNDVSSVPDDNPTFLPHWDGAAIPQRNKLPPVEDVKITSSPYKTAEPFFLDVLLTVHVSFDCVLLSLITTLFLHLGSSKSPQGTIEPLLELFDTIFILSPYLRAFVGIELKKKKYHTKTTITNMININIIIIKPVDIKNDFLVKNNFFRKNLYMSCFCGKPSYKNYKACGYSHAKIYQILKNPEQFYKSVVVAADYKSDIIWYSEGIKNYRGDVCFWMKGRKIPVILREFNNGEDVQFYV